MTKLGYVAIIICAVIIIRFVWAIVCCTKEQKAREGAKKKAPEQGKETAKEREKKNPKK